MSSPQPAATIVTTPRTNGFVRSGQVSSRISGLDSTNTTLNEACVELDTSGVPRLCTDAAITGGVIFNGLAPVADRVRIHDRADIQKPFPKVTSTYTVPANKVLELYSWNCYSESKKALIELQVDGVTVDAIRCGGDDDKSNRHDVSFEYAPIQVAAGSVVTTVLSDASNKKEAITGFSGVLFSV